MKYVQLGRSGLRVSSLCLGTDNFGTTTTEEDAWAIMDGALDLGINLIDTANVYGWRKGEGLTERIIGRWLSKGDGRRHRTVLATKVYGVISDWPNDSFLSSLNIRRACEASLRRLQTDYIDIYQLHHVDRRTPWDEIWDAMDVLRTQGKILYVGTGNHPGWNLAQGQEAARRRNAMGICSEQTVYNLLERRAELEVLPACENYGVGMLPWAPLHGGLLGGVLRKEREGSLSRPLPGARVATSKQQRNAKLELHRSQLEAYEGFCVELGFDPSSVALAWLLGRPGVTAPIIGPRTRSQLISSVAALGLSLDDDALTRLEAIFPGPGPSPEAYAW